MVRKNYSFTVIVHKDEDMFVSECPEVGTVSQGSTIEEAIDNLKEATELYLEEFPIKQESKPVMGIFEIIKNDKTKEAIQA
ncbi:MAG: type II toxin-antitoxin system HicB family antitoxin [Candidatus Aenigmarchaeota archaeon]|nr:type II toxin-antitoxin system HicB family antitoxin [Candidatus Aenigmarchaeota archaeon]